MIAAYAKIEDEGVPKSVQGEMTILGAMMLEPDAVEQATRILHEDDFYLESHRRIYRALTQMANAGQPIDLLTVSEHMKPGGDLKSVGDVPYLAGLTEGIPRKLSIEKWARIVRDHSLARWGINICERAVRRFGDRADEALVVFNEVEAELSQAAVGVVAEDNLDTQADKEWDLLQRQRSGEQNVFVPSGCSFFDATHGGYALGEMTVIAARPKIGKSTFLRQGIAANCEEGNFVHLFTPEMRAGQVHRCLWAYVAQIPFHKVRFPERMTKREHDYLEGAKRAVSAWPLKIDDTPMISAPEIIQRARRVKRKHNTKLMGVDYLQKLRYRGRSENRAMEVTDSIVSLTSYAKTEMVALCVLSSLTEPSGKDRNRIPTIDDLRWSGDIKFEANTVCLIHREREAETQRLMAEGLFIVGAARSDADGSCKAYLDGGMQRFLSEDEWARRMRA